MLKQILLLFLICIPGILLSVANTLKAIEKNFIQMGRVMPPKWIMSKVLLLQNFGIVIIAILLGSYFAAKSGLETPAIQALCSGTSLIPILKEQLLVAIVAGFLGALFMMTYYFYFLKRTLAAESVQAIENMSKEISLFSKLLYSGVVEEVIARFGIMSVLFFVFSSLASLSPIVAVWLAMVFSGIIFAYLSLPSYYAAGAKKEKRFTMWIISQNVWLAIIFGYLFWQYGLEASIMAHIVYQISKEVEVLMKSRA